MISARQLVAEVEAARPPPKSRYRGASDHVPNLQEVNYNGESFVLGTYNVLETSLISQINFLRDDGSPTAWEQNRGDAQGLERCPFASPYRQRRREDAITGSIVTLFKSSPRVILCIQECGLPLYARLEAESENCFKLIKQTNSDYKFCVTLCSVDLDVKLASKLYTAVEISFPVNDEGNGLALLVYNVHFRYSDVQVKNNLRNILAEVHPLRPFFIVGDFNVPAMPQSSRALSAGCPLRLDGLAAWLGNEVEPPRQVHFARQRDGWTNWSYAKNCADRLRTWDHVDNVMFVESLNVGSELPDALALGWSVEMYK
jgi:hypothetical protein